MILYGTPEHYLLATSRRLIPSDSLLHVFVPLGLRQNRVMLKIVDVAQLCFEAKESDTSIEVDMSQRLLRSILASLKSQV